MICVNGIQCEMGSAIFSASTLFPSRLLRTIYFITMTLSNTLAMYLTWRVWSLDMEVVWRSVYVFLAFIIIAIRWIGLIMAVCQPVGRDAKED